jgi:hypothetical protein
MKDMPLNNADVDFIRSVLDRYVAGPRDHALRIRLLNGETFVLSSIIEVDEESAGYDLDPVGTWSGLIVERECVSPARERLFVPGSGVDFAGSDIDEIEDEQTGEMIFSRASRRL